jgi:pyruvate dehydrogenase E1 component alpha subunit
MDYTFFSHDAKRVAKEIGQAGLLRALEEMLLIRHFEIRGEQAYQQGKVGGFYHSYMGQEAIQTGCLLAAGGNHWFTTTYRCHALALLLGESPDSLMAELYGKRTGNAMGRGGSMHFYSQNLLGGFGIVGGHIPVATGAAFSIKYKKEKDRVSFCFFGDGASVQGALHESLNLAALWQLPAIYVIENNQWGMGTAAKRAVAVAPIAEHFAKSYAMKSYTVDGQDLFNTYAAFQDALQYVLKTGKPVLMEAICERFRGHSISDPALYRSKETLQHVMERDPIFLLKEHLNMSEEEFKTLDAAAKEKVLAAMKFAEESPWPDPMELEKGVYYGDAAD